MSHVCGAHPNAQPDDCDICFLLLLLAEARFDLIHNTERDERNVSRETIPPGTATKAEDLPRLYAAFLNLHGVVDGASVAKSLVGIARAGTAVLATVFDRIVMQEAAPLGTWGRAVTNPFPCPSGCGAMMTCPDLTKKETPQ
jgi:hypothetical protein